MKRVYNFSAGPAVLPEEVTAASAATITTTAPQLESARVFLVTIIVWLPIILATDQHDFLKYRNTHRGSYRRRQASKLWGVY